MERQNRYARREDGEYDKSEIDRNPFIELTDDAIDFKETFKLHAQTAVDKIEELTCDDKAIFQGVLDGAEDVLETARCLEEFDFVTDDPTPTRGGDRLWRAIISSVRKWAASLANLVEVWVPKDYPDDFVDHFAKLGEKILDELLTRERIFGESQVWIFMNFFKPYNPFYTRLANGLYVVQKYSKCRQSIDMKSIGLYFMVRLLDY